MLDALRNDPPGERFQRQHERLEQRSTALRVVLAIVGALLALGGVALLVLPGPGLLLIAAGLAMLGGLSGALARAMDRAELAIRRIVRRLRRGWRGWPSSRKAAAVIAGVLSAGAIGVGLFHALA